MRRRGLTASLLAAAAVVIATLPARAAVFERFLSPDRPADRAILAYLELEKSGKASSNDLAELGVLLLDKGFPKDAERYLEAAVKADRKNFEAYYRLGLVRQRMGSDRQAVRAYKKALAIRPGHGFARFMLALTEEHRGHREAAIRHYAKAYKHAPELADASVNPLVLDSRLQTEAQILRYRREVAATTLKATAIDPAAVRRMMEARHPAPTTEAAPPPKPSPVPAAPPAAPPALAKPPQLVPPPTPAPPAEAGQPAPARAPEAGPPSAATPPPAQTPPQGPALGPGTDLPPIEMRSPRTNPVRPGVIEPPTRPKPPGGSSAPGRPTPPPTPAPSPTR